MSEKERPPSSGKDLPLSFDMKFWDLENDINSLKETELLKDEDKIFEELLSTYGGLDETIQKEIQAFKLLVDSTVADGIDALTSIDGSMSPENQRKSSTGFPGP